MSAHWIAAQAEPVAETGTSVPARNRRPGAPLSEDTRLAIEIRELVVHGAGWAARERFADLLAIHQRRATRIAYQCLRDAADADEVVQDAFLKVFSHIGSYRETWSFEVWFTRILINGCLDHRRARLRRAHWFVQADAGQFRDEVRPAFSDGILDPEARLLAAAISKLDGRQRTVFMLSNYGDCTQLEVSAMIGLKEATVRVPLFRAGRKLRALLGGSA